ncbi:MAG: histidine phosphatase family protein [Lachnospiraceae bacterium]|nr:histidine phosphatase family protein [Lachnospiraceae bacterium]
MIGILRHGKTDWNLLHKIQGRTDIPLNEEGIESAREARDTVAKYCFDICYVSPLKRARQTAELILEGTGINVIVDDRLTEIGFGIYEGIEGVYGIPDHPLHDFFFAPEKYKAQNGAESIDELLVRIKNFYDDVLKELIKSRKNVLIVAHGALNAGLITLLLGNEKKDFWSYGQSNCSMFKFYPDDHEKTLEENKSTYVREMTEKDLAASIYKNK